MVDKISKHHENDGFIFTRENAPYAVGKSESLLKWKDEHTVDF